MYLYLFLLRTSLFYIYMYLILNRSILCWKSQSQRINVSIWGVSINSNEHLMGNKWQEYPILHVERYPLYNICFKCRTRLRLRQTTYVYLSLLLLSVTTSFYNFSVPVRHSIPFFWVRTFQNNLLCDKFISWFEGRVLEKVYIIFRKTFAYNV